MQPIMFLTSITFKIPLRYIVCLRGLQTVRNNMLKWDQNETVIMLLNGILIKIILKSILSTNTIKPLLSHHLSHL